MPAETRPRSGRATPLSPPRRRAAIIGATIPLLRAHGTAITTRQIAAAAGVAEGTIFSVFPDKETLVFAAVDAALDPATTIAMLGAIDPDLPLRDRLVEAVDILQAHFAEIWQLLTAVGPGTQPRPREERPDRAPTAHRGALVPLLEPASAELRRSPADAARVLLALTLGCSHPAMGEPPMPPPEIVDLFLEGVGRRDPLRRSR